MKETVKKSELFADVKIVDTNEYFKTQTIVAERSKAVIVTTPKGEHVVNFCSPGYCLIPCKDIIAPFEKLLKKIGKFTATYQHDGFGKFYIDYIPDGTKEIKIGKGDTIVPRIRLYHSYNGALALKLVFGFWRKICSNGLHGWGYETEVYLKHTAQLNDGKAAEMLTGKIAKFLENAEVNAKVFKVLHDNTPVDYVARLEEVLNAVHRAPKSLKMEIIERIEKEKNDLKMSKVNDWLIYNAINFQFNHNEDIKTPEELLNEADKKVLQYMSTHLEPQAAN